VKGVVCAVTSGKVACWGDNSNGVVDAGLKGPRSTPVVVPEIADATQVRVGQYFGCALTAAGKISCFREGSTRELSLLSDVAEIAIQDEVVLALRKNGEVTGVKLGRRGKDMEPVELPKIADGGAITASGEHACVVHKNGDVTCWGDPSRTGSGKDVSDLSWEAREAMSKEAIHPAGLKEVKQMSAGDAHTCAVLKSRKVMCWGTNYSGQLGDGSTDERRAPVAVQLLDDAVEVAVGSRHTCARRASGKVVCWGDGRAGQLGAGAASVKGMVEVKDLADAAALATAEDVSCAARAAGGVLCWGSASRGRLGNGTISDYPTPQPVKGLSGVRQLAIGDRLSCALDPQKQLQCWGAPSSWSSEDQEKRSFTPSPVSWLGEVVSVTAKDSGFCAIDKANTANCFHGWSFLKPEQKPIEIKGLKSIVSTTGSGGAGLLSSGQVFLWNNSEALRKLDLNGLSDAVSVALASSVVCAARKSGKVGCVAYHYRTFDKKDPVKPTGAVEVPDLKDAVQIVNDGHGEMCVLRKTGEVSCFSTYRVPSAVDPKAEREKAAKEKGKPKEKEKPRPIEVKPIQGLTDVTALAAGGGVFCGVKKDATLVCWGNNQHGELGRGDYSYSEGPAPVPGLTDVAVVALGGGQACAAKQNGEVLCWGDSSADQAGQPSPPFARTPVAVLLP
jgi:alpha-tubulin suppressor-like RCC1 family protein